LWADSSPMKISQNDHIREQVCSAVVSQLDQVVNESQRSVESDKRTLALFEAQKVHDDIVKLIDTSVLIAHEVAQEASKRFRLDVGVVMDPTSFVVEKCDSGKMEHLPLWATYYTMSGLVFVGRSDSKVQLDVNYTLEKNTKGLFATNSSVVLFSFNGSVVENAEQLLATIR
jgi:hypothetical protein